jgi:hypothetical protein
LILPVRGLRPANDGQDTQYLLTIVDPYFRYHVIEVSILFIQKLGEKAAKQLSTQEIIAIKDNWAPKISTENIWTPPALAIA